MTKKLTSYFLILMLAFPPFLVLKPKPANAILPLLVPLAATAARYVVANMARRGVIKTVGKDLVMTGLWRGQLMQMRSKNWTPFVASSALAVSSLLGVLGFQDNTKNTCTNWKAGTGANTGFGATAVEAVGAVPVNVYPTYYTSWSAEPYIGLDGKGFAVYGLTGYSLDYTVTPPVPVSSSQGTVQCYASSVKDRTGQELYIDILDDPSLTPLARESESKRFMDGLRVQASTVADSSFDSQSQNLSVTPVEQATADIVNADGSVTTHSYTIDPATGGILDNGTPRGDQATMVDANGIEHNYTIDPVTHNILDNGGDVGNYATWTDSEGQTHIVTEDPATGQLQDNGYAWNPNYTASNPSGGSSTTTPVSSGSTSSTGTSTNTAVTTDAAGTVVSTTVTTTNTTSTGTNDVDFTPVTNALGRVVTETKKTTDAVNNLNDSLVANRNDDIASETSQLDTIRASESGKSYMGVTGFMNRVKSSPFYSSVSTGLNFTGSSGYPSWSATPHIPIMGQDFTFTIGLDTADYAGLFLAIKSVFLVVTSFFAFRRVFG